MDERVAKVLRRERMRLEIQSKEFDVEMARERLTEARRKLDEAYATSDAINKALREGGAPLETEA